MAQNPLSLKRQAAYTYAKAAGYLEFDNLMRALKTAPVIPLDALYEPAPTAVKRALCAEFYAILTGFYTAEQKKRLFETAYTIGDTILAQHLLNSFTISERRSLEDKAKARDTLFRTYQDIIKANYHSETTLATEKLRTMWLDLLRYGYIQMAQQLYTQLISQQKNMCHWFCESMLPIMGQAMKNRSREKTPAAIQTEQNCWEIFTWCYTMLTPEQQTTIHNMHCTDQGCMGSLLETACYWGNLTAVKSLYRGYHARAFHLACINNRTDIIEWLVQQATQCEQQAYKKLIQQYFLEIIATGQLKTIQWFYNFMQDEWMTFFSIKFFLLALEKKQHEIVEFFYNKANDEQRFEMHKKLGLGPIIFIFSEIKPSHNIFLTACQKGHCDIANWILMLATSKQKKGMITQQENQKNSSISTYYPNPDTAPNTRSMMSSINQGEQQRLLKTLQKMMYIYTLLYLEQKSIVKVHRWGHHTPEDFQHWSAQQLSARIADFKRHAMNKKHSRTARAAALVDGLNQGVTPQKISQKLMIEAHKSSHPLAPTSVKILSGKKILFWRTSSLNKFLQSETGAHAIPYDPKLLNVSDDPVTLCR